ncbi:sodium:solute symporter [Mangrovibacterium marinum]|uniref:Na+/proline symporter n=1 Tax=Mangrovibacterium marinum TaxID=1639118 RepID=A0A2T5C2L9_9BACT|nr:sodium:solute symporter [Mangrovibacterium marinum]PTN08971.1 Na+/proline symporter [Mangrovibacterium marinum]
MGTLAIALIILTFFAVLMGVSWLSSRNADGETFFTGNRRSPWYLVAFGMIGSTISGVTFISVPGEVGNTAWTYLQFLLGNFIGYWLIALVLIPLYYRLQLVSIYSYLDQRFGFRSYKTGAFFFLVSQTIGASFRLYLAAGVLQLAFFNDLHIPFWLTVLLTLFLIWLYTHRAGIKTVVWTDSLQTLFILGAVGLTIWVILKQLNLNAEEMVAVVDHHPFSRIFDWDWRSKTNFFKQFFAGLGIVIVMNGLDQNMMQKNLTCRSRRDAQKNIFWFSFAFLIANIFFLSLGVLLYYYAAQKGIDLPARTDDLFPLLAIKYFGPLAGALFLLGILSAAYSSADSALTALTTSFCIDFLNLDPAAAKSKRTRMLVHVGFSLLMFLVIVIFRVINNESVVSAVFRVAGYTYGPLLGLFAFGILSQRKVIDRYVPVIGLLSPALTYLINVNSERWLGGYKFGFELLLLNGLIMVGGLFLFSKRSGTTAEA